jgi:hypothetical protein
MWAHGGFRSYYRGLTLGLMGIIPYSAIDLGCFEAQKRAYKKTRMQAKNCSYEDAEPGIFKQAISPHSRKSRCSVYGSDKWKYWGFSCFSYQPLGASVPKSARLIFRGHGYRLRERHCCRTSTTDYMTCSDAPSNMKVPEDYLRD